MKKIGFAKFLVCLCFCCVIASAVCYAADENVAVRGNVSVDGSTFFPIDTEMTKQERLEKTIYLQNLNYAAACDGVLTVINNNDRSITPMFVGEKFYIPLRFVLEYYGVGVSWEPEMRSVVMTAGEKVYRLSTNDAVMSYGEKTKQLANACVVEKGTTYVAFEDISSIILCGTYYFEEYKSGVIAVGEEWNVGRKAEADALGAMEFAVSPFFKMFI